MERCEFYPTKADDCICNAGSDVSGMFCTVEHSLDCQWANKERVKALEAELAAEQAKVAELKAELTKCQGNLQAMTEDYISEGQQLRDDLAAEKVRNKKLLWQIGEQARATAEMVERLNKTTILITDLRKAAGEAVEKTTGIRTCLQLWDQRVKDGLPATLHEDDYELLAREIDELAARLCPASVDILTAAKR